RWRPAHDPPPRRLDFPGRKMPDLRRHEVRRQLLHEIAQSGVGDDGHLLDVLVVISNEAEVGGHCAEAVPSGKRRRLDDQPGKIACLLDERIDGLRELREVVLLERGLRSNEEDGVLGVEAVFDHVDLPLLRRFQRWTPAAPRTAETIHARCSGASPMSPRKGLWSVQGMNGRTSGCMMPSASGCGRPPATPPRKTPGPE